MTSSRSCLSFMVAFVSSSRAEEHRQQVAIGRWLCPAPGVDDAVDDGVQVGEGAPRTPVAGCRQPPLEADRPEVLSYVAIHDRPGLVHDFSVGAEIGAEHRAHDNVLRQPHHLVHDVDAIASGSEARHRSTCAWVVSVMASTSAASRCRWKAGCASRRWRSQKSSSLVSSPVPSPGFRRSY